MLLLGNCCLAHSFCVLVLLSSVALSAVAWELLLGTQFLCPSVVEFCCFKCCCLGTVAWDTVAVSYCCLVLLVRTNRVLYKQTSRSHMKKFCRNLNLQPSHLLSTTLTTQLLRLIIYKKLEQAHKKDL